MDDKQCNFHKTDRTICKFVKNMNYTNYCDFRSNFSILIIFNKYKLIL